MSARSVWRAFFDEINTVYSVCTKDLSPKEFLTCILPHVPEIAPRTSCETTARASAERGVCPAAARRPAAPGARSPPGHIAVIARERRQMRACSMWHLACVFITDGEGHHNFIQQMTKLNEGWTILWRGNAGED